MKISQNQHDKLNFWFLYLIASTIIFRQFCTYLIVLYVIYNVVFYKNIRLDNRKVILTLIISSPFLLSILFFWNNDSYLLGVKALEKRFSLLLFPLFILGTSRRISFYKLLRIYSVTTTLIILFFFIRFIIVYPDLFEKYLKGIHLWEMGYTFSNSIGIHAPALNMHLAFVSVIHLYFLFKEGKLEYRILNTILFLISFGSILYVNTRNAMVLALIGYILIIGLMVFKRFDWKKASVISCTFLLIIAGSTYIFIKQYPYYKTKFMEGTFQELDKIGQLNSIENVHTKTGTLVFRLSIWKYALDVVSKNILFGVGDADAKKELFKSYSKNNETFLSKENFPVHNQYIDFSLRFGIMGLLIFILYLSNILVMGIKLNEPIIIFFFILFSGANLLDDFMIRFDGIVFSGFWITIFAHRFLQVQSYKN